MYQKINRNILCLLLLLIFVTPLFSSTVSAQEQQPLVIEIYDSNDWNQSVGTTLFEGRSYDIAVSSENDSVLIGVNITVLGMSYTTSTEQPFVTFIAPSSDESDTFIITATMQGYPSSELEVIVIKGVLSAVSHPSTVEEKKEFQVTVTDQDHVPVENALVYLTSDAEPISTDDRGIATLSAPEVNMDSSLSIQVLKSGYQPDSLTIYVTHVNGVLFSLSNSDLLQLLPLLGAVLVVIFAIVLVSWKKKRSSTTLEPHAHIRFRDQPPKRPPEKQGRQRPTESAVFAVKAKKDIHVSTSDSRVEEIRIPIQEKKKETTILSEEKGPQSAPVYQKKQQEEWFKGQDYMRYKLDEMTGKIDQHTDGKWFEGERDIKYKVDEALKKNVKKKKDDDTIIK